jgi:hypothetical protein
MTPSGTSGVLNEALSICFGDATAANAFVGPVLRRRRGRDGRRRLSGP